MMKTENGLTVSTDAPDAIAAIEMFEREILSYGQGARVIFDAVQADPACGLAQAMAACTHLFRATRQGIEDAQPFLAAARAGRNDTARERLFIAAAQAWCEERVEDASLLLKALLEGEPGDLFSTKLLQFHQLSRGDVAGMRATSAGALAVRPVDPRVLGMHAFALDQCGDRRGAERAARQALALAADPWAHHALAHVMDAEGRYAEGRAWMHGHAEAWGRCSSFLYTHNWWHAALFHIEAGDPAGALALYDERVWTMRKDYCQDQINAVALLARLELAGVDVGDRWLEIAGHVALKRRDSVDGFLDLHYVYALARAGDTQGVADLAAAAREHAASHPAIWRQVAPIAAAGLAAHAFGRYGEAADLLAPVHEQLSHLGGSTVQRELFTRITLDALGRCGRWPEAHALLSGAGGGAWKARALAGLSFAEIDRQDLAA